MTDAHKYFQCVECGAEFKRGRNTGKPSWALTCSTKCKNAHQRKLSAAANRRFRASHPHYYRDYYREYRARKKASLA